MYLFFFSSSADHFSLLLVVLIDRPDLAGRALWLFIVRLKHRTAFNWLSVFCVCCMKEQAVKANCVIIRLCVSLSHRIKSRLIGREDATSGGTFVEKPKWGQEEKTVSSFFIYSFLFGFLEIIKSSYVFVSQIWSV